METLDKLRELFPRAIDIIGTTGMQKGVIIKFPDMYLKIYDDEWNLGMYRIEEYRQYDNPSHEIIHVDERDIRTFAERYNR